MVLTEEQLNKFLPSTPPSYGSIFTGADGLVYTLNKEPGSTIQRHSINGLDLFAGRSYLPAFSAAGDLFVTNDGRMLVVDNAGYITVVDREGHFLCRFGGNSAGSERVGLFDLATGVGGGCGRPSLRARRQTELYPDIRAHPRAAGYLQGPRPVCRGAVR